ncbi:ABC transporter substrate-binding protein [Rhodococcus sp. SRB_17]|nr:ABC transporter substrate-binding protein [Rhodococcus sp. SRB_17]
MNLKDSRFVRGLAVIAVSAVVLTGCAGSSTSDGNSVTSSDRLTATRGIVGDQAIPGAPTEGGRLSFAAYMPITSLDPTVTPPTGSTGGTEMAAVYDVLMRYDADSEKFEPQMAKSLEESVDHLTWTLTLRDGVRFSDGTPFDADAVVASINRYNQKRGMFAPLFNEVVQNITAKDPATVEFTLNKPWHNFPAILSYGQGMIVAPSSQQGDKFTPIGAGPFTVENLQPSQQLDLKARSDYWGGKPHLDALRFVAIAGEKPKIDALKTGGVEMIYLRDADTVNVAKDAFPGFQDFTNMSMIGNINNSPGRPGADPVVRQAMAYAVDPAILNERARAGEGTGGSEMFGPQSFWHGEVAGILPDAVKARQLLDQAKAGGFDGKITYVAVNSPDAQQVALAVQAQLNAVGFDMTIEYANTTTDMVMRTIINHDYDLSLGALDISDIDPEVRLFNALSSTRNSTIGLKSPEIDALLSNMISAPDDDAKRAAINEIQVIVNKEQPFLTWSSTGNVFMAWSDNVYGVKPTVDLIMLFDKVFIGN